MIGDRWPSERTSFTDPETGRTITRHTGAAANSYPLYYFVSSFTPDGRHLVFHSERGGWVQLHRLDLATGEIVRLTEARMDDSGWAIWCEWHLRGVQTHLSSIDPVSGEVYWFEDDTIFATDVATLRQRELARLPKRLSIGQTAVSPDGRSLAVIHVDRVDYLARLRAREALIAMRQFAWDRDHHAWRQGIETELTLVDTTTGETRTIAETDFHFHHALFADNDTVLLNHPPGEPGMWTVRTDGTSGALWRPASSPGAHDAAVNHQVVTARGIVYEAVGTAPDGGRETWFGRFDPASQSWSEALLPVRGYCHAGFDPAGSFDFIEHAGRDRHELLSVHPAAPRGGPLETKLLRTLLSPDHEQQRHHAHPFLSLDRKTLWFTDWDEAGFAQLHSLPVGDLT